MVAAPDTVTAVRSAGGWLFDSVMAGWDVQALVRDLADARPLRILGVRAVDLDAALTSPVHGPQPHVLAVDARLYEAHAGVRKMVLRALDHALTEVLLWGEDCPSDLDGEAGPVEYRISVAARAFKSQALAAAAAPVESVTDTEVLRSGEIAPSLVPA